jgi:hypothetical protein
MMLVEERVTKLEEVLAHYIRVQERELAAIRASVTDIRASVAEIRASNARTDARLLELQEQAERDRQQAEQDRRENAERFCQWEQRAEEDRQQDADRFRQWEQRAEQDRKDFNKRLAEISDSMGTLIEDMVAPCGFQLARAIFATEEAETCAIRIKRKHPGIAGEMMELDLLATGATKVLVVEVKRRIDAGKASAYRDQLARLPEFFPELANKTVCAAVASVYLDPSVVVFLNHERLHGIAMGEDTMQVVNLGQF